MISLLVASTWVSATHFLKALYDGGIHVDWQGIRPTKNLSSRTSTNSSTTSYKNVTVSIYLIPTGGQYAISIVFLGTVLECTNSKSDLSFIGQFG